VVTSSVAARWAEIAVKPSTARPHNSPTSNAMATTIRTLIRNLRTTLISAYATAS
jgi:hypothetical protein